MTAKQKERVTLSPNFTLSDEGEYMNPEQLEYFRQKLQDWKHELLKESSETLQHLKQETWNEPDIADRATTETDTALELRTRDRYRKLIDKINQALQRIEAGEYGYCEVTGEPIGLKRLDARPIATMTVAAQEEHERVERMTLDE